MPEADQTARWRAYLAAAQALDAVRREAASTVAAATHTVSSARAELAQLRSAVERQRAELADRARLSVSPAEQAAAETLVAGDPAAVRTALGQCRELLRTADAQLTGSDRERTCWWRRLTNR